MTETQPKESATISAEAAGVLDAKVAPFDHAADSSENAPTAADENAMTAQTPAMHLERVVVDDVVVPGGHRKCDDEAVAKLAKSMATIGLRTPITVRVVKLGLPRSGLYVTQRQLVAGAHRLAAAKRLEWKEIAAFVLDSDEIDARMWELVENLERNDLNAIERSTSIDELTKLAEGRNGQPVQFEGNRRHGAIADAARSPLVPGKTEGARRKKVERSTKIAALPSEVKKAAAEAGLANNQQALLEIAKEPTAEAQMRKVTELKNRKQTKQKGKARKKATTTDSPGPSRSNEESEVLRRHVARLGHDINPDDLIVMPKSESARARPSEYGTVRLPTGHPKREELRRIIEGLRDTYNTQVFFKVFPQDLAKEASGDHQTEDDEGRDDE